MATPFFSLLLLLLLSPFSLRCNAQNGTDLLQQSEVDALNNITSMLGVKPQRYYDRYTCRRADPYAGVNCRCDMNLTIQGCVVEELIFTGLDITGVISPAVGNLLYLKTIDLSSNKLHGLIPNTLANLLHLDKLDLAYNELHGPIPNIFGINHSLTNLYLVFNFLEGPIPPSLGDLPKLKYLYLTSNLLTGQIPSELGNATSLLYLSLADNELSGTIPPQLGKLQKLNTMQISGNNFIGNLPDELKNLTELGFFSVRGNDLSGHVPDFIATWPYLNTLSLMGNKFEGVLPTGIFELKQLLFLFVTDLRVSVDSSFPSLSKSNLTSLTLRNCSLAGRFLDEISGMKHLNYLDLSFNNLVGEIPSGLQKLSYLCLTRNNLSGTFPNWVPNSASMDFSYNNFSNISFGAFNTSSYVNTFTPTELPTLPSVKIMNGSCLEEKYYLYINCGGNGTTINGSYYEEDTSNLPFYISNKGWAYSSSGDFFTSDLGPQNNTKNVTCGISVPDAPLYTSARISPLTLDYYGLCLRNGKYNVTLHFAEIVFSSIDDHSILGKRVFDIFIQGVNVVKDFDIKAEAHGPNERVIKTFPANVTHNTLNIHLYWAGKGSIYVNPQLYGPLISAISVTSDYKPGKKLSTRGIVAILASCVALLLFILAVLWKLGYLARKKFSNFALEGTSLQARKITLQNILDGTHHFSAEREIGIGGSGKVYQAVLRDGSALAVKKIHARTIIELGKYLDEVRTLVYLQNENLVQLLGWCIMDDQLLLIYEYMEKNSLQKTFFETNFVTFSWEIRYRICLQIAKGLVYLHTIAEPKIIHRDIKSSNILLDQHLNAKISDFGLARIYHEAHGTLLTKLQGTHGYMAPEYAMRGILSEKTDVYSYGVVLLEIVSRETNAKNNSGQEGEFLLDKAYVLQKDGSILQLIDRKIIDTPGYHVKQASKLLDLAIMCTNQSPSLRPTMSQVVSVLENKSTIEEISATIQEISAAKHNNKSSNASKHITASSSSASVEMTTRG